MIVTQLNKEIQGMPQKSEEDLGARLAAFTEVVEGLLNYKTPDDLHGLIIETWMQHPSSYYKREEIRKSSAAAQERQKLIDANEALGKRQSKYTKPNGS